MKLPRDIFCQNIEIYSRNNYYEFKKRKRDNPCHFRFERTLAVV